MPDFLIPLLMVIGPTCGLAAAMFLLWCNTYRLSAVFIAGLSVMSIGAAVLGDVPTALAAFGIIVIEAVILIVRLQRSRKARRARAQRESAPS